MNFLSELLWEDPERQLWSFGRLAKTIFSLSFVLTKVWREERGEVIPVITPVRPDTATTALTEPHQRLHWNEESNFHYEAQSSLVSSVFVFTLIIKHWKHHGKTTLIRSENPKEKGLKDWIIIITLRLSPDKTSLDGCEDHPPTHLLTKWPPTYLTSDLLVLYSTYIGSSLVYYQPWCNERKARQCKISLI